MEEIQRLFFWSIVSLWFNHHSNDKKGVGYRGLNFGDLSYVGFWNFTYSRRYLSRGPFWETKTEALVLSPEGDEGHSLLRRIKKKKKRKR